MYTPAGRRNTTTRSVVGIDSKVVSRPYYYIFFSALEPNFIITCGFGRYSKSETLSVPKTNASNTYTLTTIYFIRIRIRMVEG